MDSDDFSSPANLNILATLLSRLVLLGNVSSPRRPPKLEYSGSQLDKNDIEPLYRCYAVFCLGSEEPILYDVHSLKMLQVCHEFLFFILPVHTVVVDNIDDGYDAFHRSFGASMTMY